MRSPVAHKSGTRPAYDLVNKWRLIHLQELREDWNLARANQPVLPIEPLE
jgi:hypothetical protein